MSSNGCACDPFHYGIRLDLALKQHSWPSCVTPGSYWRQLDPSTEYETVSHNMVVDQLQPLCGTKGAAGSALFLLEGEKVWIREAEPASWDPMCGVPQGSMRGLCLETPADTADGQQRSCSTSGFVPR